jgi:putative IMPACT (imprinted ancient) family translation regulator
MAVSLDCENIVDAVVVVTRYFGGIKLGTGGLARAYSQAARETLRDADKELIVDKICTHCSIRVNDIGVLYRIATICNAEKLSEEFMNDLVKLTFQMPVTEYDSFSIKLKEATKGHAQISIPEPR